MVAIARITTFAKATRLAPCLPTTKTMATIATTTNKPDWSPEKYLRFEAPRGRPLNDLITFLSRSGVSQPQRIIDLGCGPGNSTIALKKQWPGAQITGVELSPAMVASAKENNSGEGIDYQAGDVKEYVAPPETDLIFSNAVFQWLPSHERIPTIVQHVQRLKPGGVLAFQVPDNFAEPSHRLMRDTAYHSRGPWAKYFMGEDSDKKPDRDPIEPVGTWYNSLKPHCESVEIWHTTYHHILEGHEAIVRWFESTGLKPYLDLLDGDEAARKAFVEQYLKGLEREYPALADGKVVLSFPRLFVVGFR
ncbi:S-adenosyl-L-methionine-dependent methyltransferase [Apiosordaria backusii]|uniref:S-adenosyl-L-methionine-dependent methyltransferase n=1 Tax=Apiosordaria backusii TaxID=314023 RepID=A0AA39ZPR4_9PEZI|nr:S-adenosyl-L-methionine-dependent methyltransferase [Apiosordaria backusii]